MKRRLALFFTLSAMAHGALVASWPGANTTREWTIPTVPLHVAIGATPSAQDASNTVPRKSARSTKQLSRPAPAPPAVAPAETPEAAGARDRDAARDTAQQAAEPSATDPYTNHLHSAISAALDQYFYYPALARRQGWEGRVEVALRVERDGRIRALHVAHSSGYPVLDRDAITTLNRIGVIPQLRDWFGGQSYDTRFAVVYRLIEG